MAVKKYKILCSSELSLQGPRACPQIVSRRCKHLLLIHRISLKEWVIQPHSSKHLMALREARFLIIPLFLSLYWIILFVSPEAPVHPGGEKQRDWGSASEGERAGTAEPSWIDGLSSEEEEKLRLILIWLLIREGQLFDSCIYLKTHFPQNMF